jgi:hypothetical protein
MARRLSSKVITDDTRKLSQFAFADWDFFMLVHGMKKSSKVSEEIFWWCQEFFVTLQK